MDKLKKEKRFDEIDLLKTIAIIMVITLHIPVLYTDFQTTHELSNYIQYACRLISEGVLIFIMINGYLLLNKPFDKEKHKKKVYKIILLFVLWGALNVILKSIIRGESITLIKVVKNVLNIKISHPYSGLLWFLQNLLGLYIIFPIIKYVHDSNKRLYKYLSAVIIFFSVGINLISLITIIIESVFKVKDIKNVVLNNFVAINPLTNNMFLLYFVLGGYIFEKKEKIKTKKNVIKLAIIGLVSWILAFIIGVIISKCNNATYLDNYNYYQIFMVFTIIGLYALCTLYVSKGNIINKIITIIGRNTMGIYFIHNFVIEIINKFFLKPNNIQLNFGERLLFLVVVFVISLIISILISKIPKLNKIIKL